MNTFSVAHFILLYSQGGDDNSSSTTYQAFLVLSAHTQDKKYLCLK
jgi:hypothetical protein